MKKLCSIFFIYAFLTQLPLLCFAQDCPCECVENTDCLANSKSNAPSSTVNFTPNYYIIAKGNVLKVAFECKFLSECAKEGDCVYFFVPKDICTSCGSLIIPMNSKFVGYVRGISPQKKLNKNARVYISINKLILPDGEELEVKAKPFSKDFSLVENGWMTAGKLTASTIGLGAIGTGVGTGLCRQWETVSGICGHEGKCRRGQGCDGGGDVLLCRGDGDGVSVGADPGRHSGLRGKGI